MEKDQDEKNTDMNSNVVTLQDLQQRKQKLLLLKKQILDKTQRNNILTLQQLPDQTERLDIESLFDFPCNSIREQELPISNIIGIINAEEAQSGNDSESLNNAKVNTNVGTLQEVSGVNLSQPTILPIAVRELPTADIVEITNVEKDADESELNNENIFILQEVNLSPPTTYPNIGDESFVDFSSDDSVQDPNYVALNEITNLQPIESRNNIDWFPERDTEPNAARDSRTRKRKADKRTWKKEVNKKNRMLGKNYTGYKKVDNKYIQNEPKSERKMGPKCNSDFCARSKVLFCSNLTEETRKDIFDTFWKMTWPEKKIQVTSLIDRTQTQRKTKTSESRRSNSKTYYLQVDGKKQRVCLISFLNTLGIKEWTVRYWLREGRRQESDFTDHPSNTVPLQSTESKRDSVKKYLDALPKLPSHYCRKTSTKQYLEPIIHTKTQLYNLYVEYAKSSSKPIASRKLFCDIFDEDNIGLFQPKKDACDFCCSYKAGNVSQEEHQRHMDLKNLARDEKKKDKEKAIQGAIHAITADLQAVKLCPSLTASALYFKTKLAVHNFTVYNLGTDQVTCYWFDETACDLKDYIRFFIHRLRNEFVSREMQRRGYMDRWLHCSKQKQYGF